MNQKVDLVTLKSPPPARYRKFYGSLKKVFETNLMTGSIVRSDHMRMNYGAVISCINLVPKVLTASKYAVIDINALSSTFMHLPKYAVVDFRTPLSYELSWFGHNILSSFAGLMEKELRNVKVVFAANELMANYCIECGARKVYVLPNYPTTSFHPTVKADQWKVSHGITQSEPLVLFTGGDKIREVYGIDMLLESWKIAEDSSDKGKLVILGDECLNYIRRKINSLEIKRFLLTGRVSTGDVANWVNSADLCLAPRTPGFSSAYYNSRDSTKISEYATLGKPVLASLYAPSDQYVLVDPNPKDFAEGILKGLDGKIHPSKPHFWEENEPLLFQALKDFWSE